MPAIKFRGVDFIQYDSLLTDEEKLVRDTTRQFIVDNLIPIIEECNRAGRFPRELVKPMAELGFFGASLKGYGCAGMGNVEYGLMTQELERGVSSACSRDCACIRFMSSEAMSRKTRGCPRCRKARSSAASDSPSQISAP